MSENPLVTIVIPAFNRAGFIVETIQSIIDQTWQNWEMIIVDDGSTDNINEVIAPFLTHRIRYYWIEHSGRLGKVRNYGIAHGTGELVAFQDSDDLWKPDKLQKQIELLKRFPDAAFVIGNGEEFGDNFIQTPDYPLLFHGNLFLPVLETEEYCFFVPTFIFKREVLRDIGTLPENDSTIHDIHFFFRMSWKYQGIFTNERLVRIRKHQKSTSSQSDTVAYRNTLPMLKEFFKEGMINKRKFTKLTSICYYKMGLVFLQRGDKASALGSFRNCTHFVKLQWRGYARWFQAQFLLRRP